MRWMAMMVGAAVAMAATPALAQDSGYRAIAAGDYASAAHALEIERKANPDRPELLLNLAAAYAFTGRAAEARRVYGLVLKLEPIDLDMSSGEIATSHQVAERGLSRLAPTLAAR